MQEQGKVGRNTFSAGKVGRWLVSWSDEPEETLLFVSLYFFGKSSSSSSTVPAFFYVKWSPVADSENSERRAGRFFSHLFIYSRFPITRTFKGNRKSLSYREFKSRITGNNKEISNEWGGNAIKQQSIRRDEHWTWTGATKIIKTKNWHGCFKTDSMFRTSVHVLFPDLCHALVTWLELSREKLYRNDLKGNENYELPHFSSGIRRASIFFTRAGVRCSLYYPCELLVV